MQVNTPFSPFSLFSPFSPFLPLSCAPWEVIRKPKLSLAMVLGLQLYLDGVSGGRYGAYQEHCRPHKGRGSEAQGVCPAPSEKVCGPPAAYKNDYKGSECVPGGPCDPKRIACYPVVP